MKKVELICPRCGKIVTYKNWFSWVLNTPFHWFGKRWTKCDKCYKYSYMERLK